jgi:hypothetical protein
MAAGQHDADASRRGQAVTGFRARWMRGESVDRLTRLARCPRSKPAPLKQAVSYNCRRLEKRNTNEDSDSLYRLRHDRCRAADGVHGRL